MTSRSLCKQINQEIKSCKGLNQRPMREEEKEDTQNLLSSTVTFFCVAISHSDLLALK